LWSARRGLRLHALHPQRIGDYFNDMDRTEYRQTQWIFKVAAAATRRRPILPIDTSSRHHQSSTPAQHADPNRNIDGYRGV